MRIGFTGTREGMTAAQRKSFRELLRKLQAGEFHVGDCVGADQRGAQIAFDFGCRMICHPPKDPKLRAFFPNYDVVMPELPFHARNRKIVDATELLIVCPKGFEEPTEGGTGYTYGYAKGKGKRTIVIAPDGSVVDSTNKEQ